VAAPVLVALLAAGCAMPVDREPRALSATTTTASPSTTPTSESGNGIAFLYFLTNGRLDAISTETSSVRPVDVLALLFDGVPAGTHSDLTTQIPAGARVLDASLAAGTLTVNISEDFNNMVGSGRTQGIAQIVLTATGLSGVRRVTFQVEGVTTLVYSPLVGDTETVDECDFVSLLPDPASLPDREDATRSQRELIDRIEQASDGCDDG